MGKLLVVIDMQNDFISGSLGTEEAKAIVSNVADTINAFDSEVVFTRDTHFDNYESTQEGTKLPVRHCIKGTDGWQICDEIKKCNKYDEKKIFDKNTFGSYELAQYIKDRNPDEVILTGLCTDICVISNAMTIKALSPEIPVCVLSDCCAGVSVQSHQTALDAMKMCQIEIK
ncbi:MAG: isochorismatase family cysteine hydrolase [Oscillospiraceae bacterium]|nr:isochorismatase family cysteine hydrolase [Oscillospiraceae bacterium]